MKKLCLPVVLLCAIGLFAAGPQTSEKQAGSAAKPSSAEEKEAKEKGHKRHRPPAAPKDIDITSDSSGDPQAADKKLSKGKNEVARWNNKNATDCKVYFDPFAAPYNIPAGGHVTSPPIGPAVPYGTYTYTIDCAGRKADPAIIVTN